eukprot:gene16544-30925_t
MGCWIEIPVLKVLKKAGPIKAHFPTRHNSGAALTTVSASTGESKRGPTDSGGGCVRLWTHCPEGTPTNVQDFTLLKSDQNQTQNLTKKAFKAMEGMEDYSPPDLMGIYFQYTRRVFDTSNLMVGAGVSSFLLSTAIYMLSGIVSWFLFPQYKTLKIQDQHRWNSGINRSIFGLMLATRGFKALLRGVPEGGIVHGTDDFLEQSSAFALGFFLFECRDSFQMHFSHGITETTLIIHHLIGVCMYVRLCFFEPAYSFLTTVIMIQEVTAPFVHLGWIFVKCGMESSPLWLLNQWGLLAAWLLCRT